MNSSNMINGGYIIMNVIILEGIDHVGKTTLSNKLSNMSNVYVVPALSKKQKLTIKAENKYDDYEYFVDAISMNILDAIVQCDYRTEHLVFDRWFLSTLVYQCRNKPECENAILTIWIPWFSNLTSFITDVGNYGVHHVYINPNFEIVKRYIKNDKGYGFDNESLDVLKQLHKRYLYFLNILKERYLDNIRFHVYDQDYLYNLGGQEFLELIYSKRND